MNNIEKVLKNPIVDQDVVEKAKKEWEVIRKELAFLEALRSAGVDNWEGYGFAWELFYEYNPEYKKE